MTDAISESIRLQGYPTPEAFFADTAGVPYQRLTERFPAGVIPIRLRQFHLSLIRDPASAVPVLADAVVRALAAPPRYAGWGVGNGWDFRFASSVVSISRVPHLRAALDAMWQELRASPPPDGWVPTAADDRHLVVALTAAVASVDWPDGTEPDPDAAVQAAVARAGAVWAGADSVETFVATWSEVAEADRYIFAVTYCDAEIRNGGFDQLFYNSTGALAPDAATGLLAMGLTQHATIVDSAVRLVGTPFPLDRAERTRRLDAIGKSLADLDEQYYRLVKQSRSMMRCARLPTVGLERPERP